MKIEIFDQVLQRQLGPKRRVPENSPHTSTAKCTTLADATQMVDSLKVAVLAALNIADEMSTPRERQKQIEGPAAQARRKVRWLWSRRLSNGSN